MHKVCGGVIMDELRDKSSADADDGDLKRIQQLESFFLPLSTDQISQVMNETVMKYVPVNSESQLCREHSLLVLESIHQGHLWALKMVDASTKMISGVLDGHLQDLGNIEQCINILHPDHLFNGQHCLVETVGFLEQNFKFDKLYPTDITFSICVPSSCSEEDVAEHVDSILNQVNASTIYSFIKNSDLEEFPTNSFLTCSHKNMQSFRLEDYIALGFLVVAVSAIVIFSISESWSRSKLDLAGISLSRSFSGLFNTQISPNEISCLNGLRVIFMVFVMAYHRLMEMLLLIPSNRRETNIQVYSSVEVRILEASTISVDVFLLMGGAVTTYVFFLKMDRNQKGSILKSILNRYIRLTPVLAVIILFYSTLLIHLSRGPLWHRTVASLETVCRDYWWTGLLHISNYYSPSPMCVGQSWYVACDFQLYVLSPLILIPLSKKPKVGAIIIITSVLSPIIYILIKSFNENHYPGSSYNCFEMQRETNDTSLVNYRGFHLRGCFYVIGMALGYIIFIIKHNKRKITLSKLFFTAGWSIAGSVLTLYTVLSLIIFHPDHVYKPWFDPLFNGFAKPLTCLALAWVIFACSLGHGGFIDCVLSWAAFRPLARLVYSVYLVHEIMMITQSYSIQVPLAFSFMDYLFFLCGDIIISYALAVLLYLFVEIPCSQLASHFLTEKKSTWERTLPSKHHQKSKD